MDILRDGKPVGVKVETGLVEMTWRKSGRASQRAGGDHADHHAEGERNNNRSRWVPAETPGASGMEAGRRTSRGGSSGGSRSSRGGAPGGGGPPSGGAREGGDGPCHS